jgi:hypothetical protein
LVNSNENQHLNKSPTESASSSSDEDIDADDEEETKTDSNIPDDEMFFDHTDTETNENIQPNNMMDIFRRQSSNTNNNNNNTNEDDALEENEPKIREEPISSSTPERDILTQVLSVADTDENNTRKKLRFGEEDGQQNGEVDSGDDDDLSLEDNFSFLIAKGMLKPSSF